MAQTKKGQALVEFAAAAVVVFPLVTGILALTLATVAYFWFKTETYAKAREVLYSQAVDCHASSALRGLSTFIAVSYRCDPAGYIEGTLGALAAEPLRDSLNLTEKLRGRSL